MIYLLISLSLMDIIPFHLTSIILAVLNPHVFAAVPDENKHEKLQVLLPQIPMLLQLKWLSKQMFLQILMTQLYKLVTALPLLIYLLLHKLDLELEIAKYA